MPTFRARRQATPEHHECEYRSAVARVRVELEAAQATHGRNVPVNAAKVLDLLSPSGMWRYIDRDTDPMPKLPDGDDDLDPMTGCKPVTAQSGPDKVQEAVRRSRGGPPPPPVQGYA